MTPALVLCRSRREYQASPLSHLFHHQPTFNLPDDLYIYVNFSLQSSPMVARALSAEPHRRAYLYTHIISVKTASDEHTRRSFGDVL